MLCEMCHEREANVHVSGNRRVDAGSRKTEDFVHHYCEACAATSPLVNPALNYGPDAIREELRVISVTAERTRVRLARTETEQMPEEWDLLTARLPASYAVVGMEFEILCSPEELRFLKGDA